MEDLCALEGMKRAELQRLAKNAGIKANMKTDAIIQALKKYYTSESGSLSATEGTSCSEDNKTEDESATSSVESAGATTNDEQETEQEMTKTTPPKRAVRRGRKGRKKATKKTTKAATAEAPSKSPEQISKPEAPATRSATPKAECVPNKTTPVPTEVAIRRKTRSVTPKTRGSSAQATEIAPAKVQNRRQTRSITPKPIKGRSAPPAEVQIRRKTRSVTPKTDAAAPTIAAPADVPARRRTFEKAAEDKASVQSDPEMKKAILAQLEQKATEKLAAQSRIPRSKTATWKTSKPDTPGNKDWSRIHQQQFNKMESIDDYVARKRKRTETLSASVKRAKIIADEAKAVVKNLKSSRTPHGSTGKIVKPVSRLRGDTRLSFSSPKPAATKVPANKTAPTAKAPANKSVTFKVSRLKTPAKATQLLGGAKVPIREKRKSTPGPRKSVSAIQTSAKKPTMEWSLGRKSMGDSALEKRKSVGGPITPFKFGQTAITPAKDVCSKSAFDLKASLSKPLTYKPHTGKLMPLEVSSRFQATSNIQRAKANVMKKPALKTRGDRRAGANQNRANKRANNIMARRGISAL